MLGLYKGVSAPLLLTGAINSILFGLNSIIVNGVLRPYSIGSSRPSDIGKPFTFSEAALTGVLSGSIISVIVTPIEGVKARLQVQYASKAASKYRGSLDCAKQVVRTLTTDSTASNSASAKHNRVNQEHIVVSRGTYPLRFLLKPAHTAHSKPNKLKRFAKLIQLYREFTVVNRRNDFVLPVFVQSEPGNINACNTLGALHSKADRQKHTYIRR